MFFVGYNVFSIAKPVSSLEYIETHQNCICVLTQNIIKWIIINMVVYEHMTMVGIIACIGFLVLSYINYSQSFENLDYFMFKYAMKNKFIFSFAVPVNWSTVKT